MLWYIIFVVVVHIFRCYSTCFSMLHYIVLRCCSIYIKILHYIIFSYVCDIVLEVFRALWDRGAVRERGVLGNGDRDAVGNGGQGRDVDAIPFRSIPIRFLFRSSFHSFLFRCRGHGFGKGSGVWTHLTRRTSGH